MIESQQCVWKDVDLVPCLVRSRGILEDKTLSFEDIGGHGERYLVTIRERSVGQRGDKDPAILP